MATIARLPPYPPTQARRQISASLLASLNATIALTLAKTISLPLAKCDVESSRVYVQTYAHDISLQVLQALIWEPHKASDSGISRDEGLIRKYTLLLAEKLAGNLDLQTLLDLTIGYSFDKKNKPRLRSVLSSASAAGNSIHDMVAKDLVPALTLLLFPEASTNRTQGLYALRKAAHCVFSFLSVAPPAFVRHFSQNKHFILALAQTYDASLTSIATSYGGFNALRNTMARSNIEADDWERIWVNTKVALIDSFHIILNRLLEDLASAKGNALGPEAERTFDIIFALLDHPTSVSESSAASSIPPTPFLNRSLLTDYQQSYSLSQTLSVVVRNAEEKDARLDILESALAALDGPLSSKDPGALKIVLHSYGMQQGIGDLGKRSHSQQSPGAATSTSTKLGSTSSTSGPPPITSSDSSKGKGKAPVPASDPDLDIKVTQVLDVLPDLSPGYVRLLLSSEKYKGDLEQVLGALLEDRAPSEDALVREIEQQENRQTINKSVGDGGYDFSQRQNVFDDQDMDLSKVRIGKTNIEGITPQDRAYVTQMKADILRRAEAIFEEEEEEVDITGGNSGMAVRRPGQWSLFNPEDEFEEVEAVKVKVTGDGEESEESDTGGEDNTEREEEKMTTETILELAWIHDPKLFARDAATRRSKGRDQLKRDTGWADEQIEGWKIMLDRNPKMQEKIKQKHEFRGNQAPISVPGPSGRIDVRPGRGGERGRSHGRGRGGRGRGGNMTGGDTNTPQERASKDKHKASRANHNRKRGHDKKMARAGAGVPPSS